MSVKYLFSTLAILLATLTVFPLDTIADSESASDRSTGLWSIGLCLVFVLVVVGAILSNRKESRKKNAFLKDHSSLLSSEDPKVLLQLAEKCKAYLKEQYSAKVSSLLQQSEAKSESVFLKDHSSLLSSEDPKVLLELAEKCDTYLKDRYSPEVTRLSQQAKTKRAKIQIQANLETFKSEISEDGSHPRVVATLKEQMHNPDSFQHVSSDYETVEQEGKRYHKIVMTFRGRNTFNALVLQTCYFLVDEDNQVSLVGSPDDTESSPVNTAQLAASADAAAIAVEGVATLADLLSFFTSE